MNAAGGADEDVMGVEVGGRPRVRRRLGRLAGAPAADDQGITDDQPAGRRHPRRLDDVRARLVAAADRRAVFDGPNRRPPADAVEHRGEHVRRVEAGRAEPLDRPVGSDRAPRCGSRRGRRSRRSPGTARMASAARGTASAPAACRGPCHRRGAAPARPGRQPLRGLEPAVRTTGRVRRLHRTKVAAAAVEAAGVAPSATARPPGANPPTAPRDLMRSARISDCQDRRGCRLAVGGAARVAGFAFASSLPATAYRRSRTSRRRGSWSSPS